MARELVNNNNNTNAPKTIHDEILEKLLEDPTKSIREIASDLKSYRQKVWRKKKKMEDEGIIWGYTAVVDESKLNHVTYLLLLKMRPMDTDLAELMASRVLIGEACKQKVRLIDMLYVNGQYDWVIRFSAPDHTTARRYYDCLRVVYANYLLEKPVMIDVNFSLVNEGKVNPELQRIYDFVPV